MVGEVIGLMLFDVEEGSQEDERTSFISRKRGPRIYSNPELKRLTTCLIMLDHDQS